MARYPHPTPASCPGGHSASDQQDQGLRVLSTLQGEVLPSAGSARHRDSWSGRYCSHKASQCHLHAEGSSTLYLDLPLEHCSNATAHSLFCAPRTQVCCAPSPHRRLTYADFSPTCYLLPEDTRQGACMASRPLLSQSSLKTASWRPDLSTSHLCLPAPRSGHHRQGQSLCMRPLLTDMTGTQRLV